MKRPGDLSVRCTLLLMLDYQVCASPLPYRHHTRTWTPPTLSLRVGLGLRGVHPETPFSSLLPFSRCMFLWSPITKSFLAPACLPYALSTLSFI